MARGKAWRIVSILALQLVAPPGPVSAGDNLRLAADLSFVDDASDAFPIQGDHLDDADVPKGRAAVMFFGTSHCWNTNREAERLVSLYAKYRDRVTFIVVDVVHPSRAQRPLLETYYRGFIPTLVVLDRQRSIVYAKSGETARARGDARVLDALITGAVGDVAHPRGG